MVLVATCSDYPHPTSQLEVLLAALRALGAEADFRPWKRTPLGALAAFDAALPLCRRDMTIRGFERLSLRPCREGAGERYAAARMAHPDSERG